MYYQTYYHRQKSNSRQQQYSQSFKSDTSKQVESTKQSKLSQSKNSQLRSSDVSNSNSKMNTKQIQEKEMKPIANNQPLQNTIIASVNQNGQPPSYIPKNSSKKKSSFIELLCRCFLGSSNSNQTNDEKTTQVEPDNKQLGPQFEHNKGKKTLILDLDETLVHSSFQPMANSDYTLSIKVQNVPFTIHVKKRPGVEQFLEKVSESFEVVMYTASLAEYADPVCDLIDPKRTFSYRLFREHCTCFQRLFVKDLSKIGRDLKDLLIVDNSQTSFLFQPENAIQISNFFQDDNDRELYRILPFLQFLSDVKDVRTTKGWMEKYLSQDYIEYINMNDECLKYNKNLQLKKQRTIKNNVEGSKIPFMNQNSVGRDESLAEINQTGLNHFLNNKNISNDSKNDENQNKQSHLQKSILNSENANFVDVDGKSQKVNTSKVLNSSLSTQSGAIKKFKKKDLVIQLPTDEKNKNGYNQNAMYENDNTIHEQMIEEYNQKFSNPNMISVRTKVESTRKLLERGTPRVDDFFIHKTCPDEELSTQNQKKDTQNNRLNKSFEKQRYDIGIFNINSPIAQKDFIDFLKEPIQYSPKLNKISNYFASNKKNQPATQDKNNNNFKIQLKQSDKNQQHEIDINQLQVDQIILDRSHNSDMQKQEKGFDKQINPNQKCEMIDFTDDNIQN